MDTAEMVKGVTVVLFGPMGAGKTTIAGRMSSPMARISFADPIKSAAQTLLGAGYVFYKTDKAQMRRVYQEIGKAGRSVDPHFVTRMINARIKQFRSKDPDFAFVVDDGRTLEELAWARSQRRTITIYVETPEEERMRRIRERDGRLPTEEERCDETETTEFLKPLCHLVVDGTDDERAAQRIFDAVRVYRYGEALALKEAAAMQG